MSALTRARAHTAQERKGVILLPPSGGLGRASWGGAPRGGIGYGPANGSGIWGPAFGFSWGPARGADLFKPGGRSSQRTRGLATPAIITSRSTHNWRTQAVEEVLWNLARNAENGMVQVYACAALLDRWEGPPRPMVIEAPVDPISLMTDEEIKAELARLRADRWD